MLITDKESRASSLSVSTYLVIALLSGLGVLGKAPLLAHLLHIPQIICWGLLSAVFMAPLLWRFAIRLRGILTYAFLLLFIFSIVFLYPRVRQLHSIGRGSDQADCILVAGNQLVHGEWPYRRDLLWSHNPMSCGPGWVALQTPIFELLGYRALVIVMWVVSIVWLIRLLGWDLSSRMLTMSFLSMGVWLAAVNGTDFLTFGICVATIAEIYEYSEKSSPWLLILTGLIAQFRFPVVFLPLFLKQDDRRLRMILVSAFAFATFLAFFLWHPREMIVDGPLFLFHKFTPTLAAHSYSGIQLAIAGSLLLCAFTACVISGRIFNGINVALWYMIVIFGVPALLDLFLKLRTSASVALALEHWQGGIWLVGCLPLSTLVVSKEASHATSVQDATF